MYNNNFSYFSAVSTADGRRARRTSSYYLPALSFRKFHIPALGRLRFKSVRGTSTFCLQAVQ